MRWGEIYRPAMSDKSNRTASFTRPPETRGKNLPYDQKFSVLIEVCNDAKTEGVENVMVVCPWVIGDSYEEVVESLSRIAEAGLALLVVERDKTMPGLTGASLN